MKFEDSLGVHWRIGKAIHGVKIRLLYQRPGTEGLTSGAEAGAAVLHQDPLDGAAANGAGFVSLVSNLEIKMSCAQLALGTDVGIHTGAFAADGCPKNSADAIM